MVNVVLAVQSMKLDIYHRVITDAIWIGLSRIGELQYLFQFETVTLASITLIKKCDL